MRLFKSLGWRAADQKAVTGSGNLSNCDGRNEGNLDPVTAPEKNGKEAPIWGVAQFGEMGHPGS